MKLKYAFGTIFAVVLLVGTGQAQNYSHTVSVDVKAVNLLDVSDHTVELTLDTGTLGSTTITGNTDTATLRWTTNVANQVIQVSAEHTSGTALDLFVTGCGDIGTKTFTNGEGTVSLQKVGKSAGSCEVTYGAEADVEDGVTTGEFEVTYTFTVN